MSKIWSFWPRVAWPLGVVRRRSLRWDRHSGGRHCAGHTRLFDEARFRKPLTGWPTAQLLQISGVLPKERLRMDLLDLREQVCGRSNTVVCEEIWNSCSVGLRNPIKFHISGFTTPFLDCIAMCPESSIKKLRAACESRAVKTRNTCMTVVSSEIAGEDERPAECGGRFGRVLGKDQSCGLGVCCLFGGIAKGVRKCAS